MTSKIISTDNATVVIQINPQVAQDSVISDDGQAERVSHCSTVLKGFLKVQPKSLGTVQIMTGVIGILFGIVLTISNKYHFSSVTVFSGVFYWGSLIYISAGSLSVAAAKKLNPCLVKASLGMNVFSTITAGVTIILTSIGIEIMTNRYCFYGNRGSEQTLCSNTTIHVSGINGILLVFSILQFIISICISAFACKVTCNRDSTVVNVLLNQRPDSQ
ncbi:membrane-spanning 4-domains subfamily A member 4A-like isoform X2 [Myxocyprinus asiaticus]|uniref:membrane-spanning 4-domains subfamily A member 4A-like isoform X2 n=1 Tax=Myxocyprinus asiaticus TaxID=70543 RepID=UPI0022236A4F|nr:membrane-spanning 4-domains subfamily A member 4A-like isoform X2 [Myxocyprinus asiaticus]XP_051519989.1 membrane-spanning 4-domains subfamily A member 4A-like isoform X2 [Myxocyprinus asiaticus]